ncbi:MAG: tRNA (adenosine(37)-N6)-dimethylallyltransferase MiaA [Alistipes sp.]
MTTNRRLIVIVGATGSGKTDLSIRIAQHYAAPILSTDSRQVFRGMPIGTAQPSVAQLQAVDHYFIASHELTDDFNCGAYEEQALTRLEQLFETHPFVVAVGGSGLYVQALCKGMDTLPAVDAQLRAALGNRLKTEGLASLVAQLKDLDPAFYAVVDRNNPARVLRALEVCLQTGVPYSAQRTGAPRTRDFDTVKIGIDVPREELYDRINRRVDEMLARGLEDEVRRLYPYKHLNALQTVGYKELFAWMDGEITYEEAVELIKRNSRRYAKRQMTWFRRDTQIRWFAPNEVEAMISYIDFCKL